MMKTCSKCKEEKSTEFYTSDLSKADGLYSSCRACRRRYDMLSGRTKFPERLSSDYKRCTKCKKALPKVDFRKDGAKKDGLYPSCNNCQRLRTCARKMPTKVIDSTGYRRKSGRRLHRQIMENIFKRKLNRSEVVHHINHNKLDNRPENLIVLTQGEHMKQHAKDRLSTQLT